MLAEIGDISRFRSPRKLASPPPPRPPQAGGAHKPRAGSLLRHGSAPGRARSSDGAWPGPRTHGHGVRPTTRPDAGWVLARPLRPPTPGTARDSPQKPATKGPFLAFDDPSPFVGLKLVRPRRCRP